jgi:hypothetical protein
MASYRTGIVMNQLKLLATASLFLWFFQSSAANAGIIFYDLNGTAGAGLLPGNEPGAISGGTGGEIGSGIFLDDTTNLLTINVGWGSSQGFTDLSSASNNSHLHGPTTAANGNGFTQTAGVLFNLTRSSSLASGGTITSPPIALSAAQVTQLNDGKFYINIHTATNGGGELRGFIVTAVPEPGSMLLIVVGGAIGVLRLRKRMAK